MIMTFELLLSLLQWKVLLSVLLTRKQAELDTSLKVTVAKVLHEEVLFLFLFVKRYTVIYAYMDALHRHIMREDDSKHPFLLRWEKLDHQQSLTSDFK